MPIDLAKRSVAASPFAPHRFGLLSVADQPPTPDTYWRLGIQTQPNPCDEAGSTVDRCPVVSSSGPKSATSDGFPSWGADPFTVFAQIPCSPAGSWEAIEQRTVDALTHGEGRAVERFVWTGATTVTGASVNPHLAEDAIEFDSAGNIVQTAATVVTGAPAGTVGALSALEGALGECYGGEGVIHVPMAAIPFLADHAQLVRDGDRLRTWNGNRVAVYASNNRHGPTGAVPAAGTFWWYATGAVSLRRSQVERASSVAEALDRSNNTQLYIAERTYVVNWDCCHLAVQVTPN